MLSVVSSEPEFLKFNSFTQDCFVFETGVAAFDIHESAFHPYLPCNSFDVTDLK